MTRGKKIAAIFAVAAGLTAVGTEFLRQDLPSIARDQFSKVGVDIVSEKSHHVLKNSGPYTDQYCFVVKPASGGPHREVDCIEGGNWKWSPMILELPDFAKD